MILRLVLFFSVLWFAGRAAAFEKCAEGCPPGTSGGMYTSPLQQACLMTVAIIGPKDDWIPLKDAMDPCSPGMDENRACGLSQEMVDSILAAGVKFNCSGDKYSNDVAMNGWLLGDSASANEVTTNAHAIYDFKGKHLREPLDECKVSSFADLSNQSLIDPSKISLGGPLSTRTIATDRARVGLKEPLAGSKPMPFDPLKSGKIVVGRTLYMVSINPKDFKSVMIQACPVKRTVGSDKGQPRVLAIACDNAAGNSAALLVAPIFSESDVSRAQELHPVGLYKGAIEKVGDYKDWSLESGAENSGMAISLDSNWSRMPYKPE